MELEAAIMKEIGFELKDPGCRLGIGYKSYDNNPSCQEIRKEAADKIKGVIKEYHEKNKDSIAPPDEDLIRTVKMIAESRKEGEYSVANTWRASLSVIEEHIRQATEFESTRTKAYLSMQLFLKNTYLRDDSFVSTR